MTKRRMTDRKKQILDLLSNHEYYSEQYGSDNYPITAHELTQTGSRTEYMSIRRTLEAMVKEGLLVRIETNKGYYNATYHRQIMRGTVIGYDLPVDKRPPRPVIAKPELTPEERRAILSKMFG